MQAIGIVAHTSRIAKAKELQQQVKAEFISIDDGTLGCNRNHRHVWSQLGHSPTRWALVLEDDALPVDRFLDQAAAALDAAPTPIVSLYLGTSRPISWQDRIRQAVTRADKADACWITSAKLLHAVAVAIRTDLIGDMLNHLAPGTPIDNAISQWAVKRRHGIAYTWPSLVDHGDGATLVNHTYDAQSQPRRAWRTTVRSDWHTTTVGM